MKMKLLSATLAIAFLLAAPSSANSLSDWNSLSQSQRDAIEKSARSENYIWRRVPPGTATVNAYRRYYYNKSTGGTWGYTSDGRLTGTVSGLKDCRNGGC